MISTKINYFEHGRTRNIIVGIVLINLVVAASTIGYILIEDVTLVESFYMAVITISTVGFGEVFPLSTNGRIFTVFVIILGTSTVAYTAVQLLEYIIVGEMRYIFGRKRMERNILRTKNHWIVCGYGRMGRVICKQLRREKIPIVVLEKKPEAVEELIQKNIMYISDDATSSDTLLQARIMQAQGLITAVGSDSENVYICLTGRGYNPDLFIISRAMTDEGAVRLFWAGANKVFSPYTVGGLQIANTITRPNVSEFFELVMSKGGEEKDIQIDEISIGSKSPLKGQKIGETNLVKTNMLVIGLKTANAVFSYNPPRSTVLHEGDCLIVLGRRGDYLKFIKEMGQITA